MIDARSFTVGPLQENCLHRPSPGRRRRGDDRSGRRGRAPDRRARRARRHDLEAILLTHTHLDHIGAVAPLAARTGAPVYCPALERHILADIDGRHAPARVRPLRELRRRRAVSGGERLELAGLEIDVPSRRATAPAT